MISQHWIPPWQARLRASTPVLICAALAAPLSSVCEAATSVVVDSAKRHQTIDGFGSSQRVFDDPLVFGNVDPATNRAATVMTQAQRVEILDRLYSDLKLTRIRPASPDTTAGGGIEPINDNIDPYITDLSMFNFAWKRLDAHVQHFIEARQRGADSLFLSPINREAWMGTTTDNDVAEYSEWLMAQVRRATQLGAPPQYLSIANEPSSAGNDMSGEFIRDVIKNVGPRLQAQGYDTLFVTPDDVRSSATASKAQIVLADPLARPYVGALATHLYDEPVANVGQLQILASQYDLPLWMTEFSVAGMSTAGLPQDAMRWASLMQDLISTYDVSAIDYKWGSLGGAGDDATTLITLNTTGATYDGYSLNKAYYAMGQFSRFIAPGSQRIDAISNDADVKTTAFLRDSEIILVATNSSSASREVTFDLRGISPAEFERVRTSLTENWASLPNVVVNGSMFTVTLPAESIETFTANLSTRLAGDFSENGKVNEADLGLWQAGFAFANPALHIDGDANGDARVDGSDFLVWQRDLGLEMTVAAGDVNSLDFVDAGDLALWQSVFEANGADSDERSDADGDLDVDGADFLFWQRQLGEVALAAPNSSPAPEPATLAILAVAILGATSLAQNNKERRFPAH